MVILMKYLMVYLLATVKFVFSFPLAAGYHLNFIEMFVFTSLGGISGVLFFAFLTNPIVRIWKAITPKKKNRVNKHEQAHETKRINYKRNRRMIKLKNSYGLAGLIIFTPFLLSIPFGTFLTVRYFGAKFKIILMLVITVILFSLLFTILTELFEKEIVIWFLK